jgi:thiol:disulfide interchange protein
VRVAAKTTHPSEYMKRTLTSLLLLLLAVAPAFSAELFVDLKVEAACKQAAKENKLVLIDFYTTWCSPCKLLDKTTWTDQEVIKQVSDKAVALRIDAEKEAGLASSLQD